MQDISRVAVIDIGKTNAKVVLFDLATSSEVAARTVPNRVRDTAPYPHFDTEALWNFILSALKELYVERGFEAISITAHGATIVVLDGKGELALPVLDYEHAGPDDLADEYDAIRPPFAETGSARLPGGLNVGAQLFWQQQRFADLFDQVETIIAYPQYWAFRLTGVLANEITSIACHTDLWAPWKNDYSTLTDAMGWRRKMPPMRKADDVLGTIRSEVAAATGLPAGMPVYCGLHDSNASLLPHLWASEPPFAVVSTGTWVVMLAPGARPVSLDEHRDTLVNVSALGQPVPSARFMGGRAFQLLAPAGDVEILPEDRRRVLGEPVFFLPSLPEGSGPFPHHHGGWSCEKNSLSPGARLLAVSYYLALMTATSLDLIGAEGDIVVEGPFAANPSYLDMLAAVTGRPVRLSAGATGTSLGTAGLVLRDKREIAPRTRIWTADADASLEAYAVAWKAAVAAQSE